MNLWDIKAKHYARYTPKLNHLQKKSFEALSKLNIDLNNKHIIDIGCGTGVWSLHLAGKAKHLDALDSSKNMLEILQDDALKLKFHNITYIHSSFKDFVPKQSYDLAFLSMSSALENEALMQKFLKLAPKRVYLNFIGNRKSDFLAFVFKAFKHDNKKPRKKDLESFLKQHQIPVYKQVFSETRRVKRSPQEALENASWHLKMSGIDPAGLEKLIGTQNIDETIRSKFKLLIF
ncbi:class I SAM-dependent methyltransferase [Campylobacter sp. MIT 12-5580]|uniref:methyltransferase domain-containing protein n=1 Tax=Campylobacter sp. MIT 12-5580 TaxID=2040651 RepID=UPI0010F44900|nr:class I SAM-dependent methyltransferase [Campylobacter sp. MIT 12-5580]TKX29781.1 class I SAM-dependent methyltransferase [Campylobacter sp. MIT 12-5580]